MVKTEKACKEQSVATLYQDAEVAETYVEKRFAVSWSRLLHWKQVASINSVIASHHPQVVVEVAPGPARLTTEVEGVQEGVLVEYSQEMLMEARERLTRVGLADKWDVRHGNAFDLAPQKLQCDFLYTFRFIRHFNTEDRTRIYDNLRQCLKPQGLLMFDVVNRTVRQTLDAKRPAKPSGELEVYDVTYSPTDFQEEMESHGFEVLSLEPVVKHFDLQTWVSYSLGPRIGPLTDPLVRLIELLPSSEPLEWITLCRLKS